jgi:hypothetical protein
MDDDAPSAGPIPAARLTQGREAIVAIAARWRDQPWFKPMLAAAPGPVGHELLHFAEVAERGDAGGAILQLRDTIEALVKFVTIVLARDLLSCRSSDLI